MTSSSKKKTKSSKKRLIIDLVIIAVIILAVLLVYVDNKRIVVTNYELETEKIESDIRILQISDFHNSSFGKDNERIINMIRDINPDYIVVTGDLIDKLITKIDVSVDFLEQIKDIAPVYYCPGNHEAWVSDKYDILREDLKIIGVNVLENDGIKTDDIFIMGIMDPEMYNEFGVEDETFIEYGISQVDYSSDDFVVLLSHRPETYNAYLNKGIDLVFTGHAHGGLIRIPFVGGMIAPNQGIFPEYTAGKYTDGKTSMIISRGLGNSLTLLRVNDTPELVVVDIRSSR